MVKKTTIDNFKVDLSFAAPQNCKYCGKPHKLITVKDLSIFAPDCDCIEKLEAIREKEKEKKAHWNGLKKRYKIASFPFDTRLKRFKRLKCENTQTAREYIQNFKSKQRNGLFLVGQVGNGKTTFAVCIGKELILRGFKVKFMTFSNAIRLIQSTYGLKNSLEFTEQVEELAKYDLVIFDDFGREAYKDRTLTDVTDLINHLYTEKTNVIITTNPEMLTKIKKIPDFAAIFDRFSEMTQIVHFKNPSYRQRNKQP